jgi:hypothetical protein
MFSNPSYYQRKHEYVHEVHFGGQAVKYREATQCIATLAIIGKGMAMCSSEEVSQVNQKVNAFMHSHGLEHVGWLRVVSQGGPVSASDIQM